MNQQLREAAGLSSTAEPYSQTLSTVQKPGRTYVRFAYVLTKFIHAWLSYKNWLKTAIAFLKLAAPFLPKASSVLLKEYEWAADPVKEYTQLLIEQCYLELERSGITLHPELKDGMKILVGTTIECMTIEMLMNAMVHFSGNQDVMFPDTYNGYMTSFANQSAVPVSTESYLMPYLNITRPNC